MFASYYESKHMIKRLREEYRFPFFVRSLGRSACVTAIARRGGGFPYHHLLWVQQGELIFNMKQQKICLKAGEGVLFCKDIPHCYYPNAESAEECITRWITFEGAEELFSYHGVKDFFAFKAADYWMYEFDKIESLFSEGGDVALRAARGYMFLAEILHGWFAPSVPVYQRVQQYLEAHFSEMLSLEQLAQVAGMNPYALCRYYKAKTGTTVMNQLKLIRMAKAKELLLHSAHPVHEIATLCGFETASYFGRVFRKEVGMSPREYRERNKKG